MKPMLYCLIYLIVISCAPGKTNETTVDSTLLAPSTLTKEVAAPPEPPIDVSKISSPKFPEYSDKIFTEDESEATITNELMALLHEYEARKLLKIKSTYSMTYPVGNDGDDSTEDATLTETNTWYYDANRKLSVYTHTSKDAYVQRDVNDGSERMISQKTTIYLFADEQLSAVYDDYESNGQIYISHKERIVVGQCPICGRKISEDTMTSEGLNVSPIEQNRVSELSKIFFEEYKKMIVDLQRTRIERVSGDNCLFSVQKPWDDRAYTLNYTSNQSIYMTLLKAKL